VTALQLVTLLLVAAGGTAAVFTRDPARQVAVSGIYGLVLVVLFVVLQAPDVAMAGIAVSSAAFSLVLLSAVVKQRGRSGA
jgi:energy-converting hydrogenase B subunit D